MQVIDLSLAINRQMQGIPNRHEYDDNPTRCVVFSCLSENQLEKNRARGLEIAQLPGLMILFMSLRHAA